MIGNSLYEKNCNYKIRIKKLEYKKIVLKFREKYMMGNLVSIKNSEFDNLNNFIDKKNEIKIYEIISNTISQILDKRKIYKIENNKLYYLISKITQLSDCCKYFKKIDKKNLQTFLKICLNNILENNDFIKYSNFIFNNIFLDSKDNYFLTLLIENNDIEKILIKIINKNHFLEDLEKNNIVTLFYHIFEKKKKFTEEFIFEIIKKIELLSYKENNFFIDLIYILSILISNNKKIIYFNHLKNTLKTALKIFNSINSLEKKYKERFFMLIDLFNLYLYLNNNKKENQKFILQKNFLNNIIILLMNDNKNIKLKALLLIGNIVLEFDEIDKFIFWEKNYKKIFDCFLFGVYLGDQNVKFESLICLRNLIENTTENFLDNFIDENISNLIEFVRMSLVNDNSDLIISKIFELLGIFIRNKNFANDLMYNEQITKIFEEKQKYKIFSEEIEKIINCIKDNYYE